MKHPDEETIIRYLDDDLPAATMREVQRHLEACPACMKKSEEFESGSFDDEDLARFLGKYRSYLSLCGEAGPDCLDDNAICNYVDGSMSESEKSAAESHIASCPRCAVEVDETLRTLPKSLKYGRTKRNLLAVADFTRQAVSAFGDKSRKTIMSASETLSEFGKELKGTRCLNCGATAPFNANHCPECGEKMERAATEVVNEIICPSCDRPIHGGERKCSHCGYKIIRPASEIARYYHVARMWLPKGLRENKWFIAAVASILASLAFSHIFIQFCVAAGIFGGAWIFDKARRSQFKDLHDAWKRGDEKECERLKKEIKQKK